MSLREECLACFGTTDLYDIFGLKRSKKPDGAAIKKAFYKMAMLWHPDRFSGDEHEMQRSLANKKFQTLNRAYRVLSDEELREAYDDTGAMDDNDTGDSNWYEVFRSMFKEFTEEDIKKTLAAYRGTQEQIDDVRAAYVKHKGDIGCILASVMGFEAEDEDRLCEIIWKLINDGEVEAYTKFINEPPEARKKRAERRKREKVEARKLGNKIKAETGQDDLFAAIRSRQTQRNSDLYESLKRKYIDQ